MKPLLAALSKIPVFPTLPTAGHVPPDCFFFFFLLSLQHLIFNVLFYLFTLFVECGSHQSVSFSRAEIFVVLFTAISSTYNSA